MKKKARKTVSLVVAVIMALTMMPGIGTFSFADESDSVKTEAAAEAKEVKQETKKEEPKKEEPKKEEPKQEAPKQEEPKSNDPEPAPEPKATEPEESDQTEEVTEETQATSENGEESEVVETDPTDPTKPDEDKEDEEEKMPAQSFSGSAGGVSVKASAGEGVFPEGTKMKVASVSSSYVINAANSAMGDNFDVVDAAAVDINFYKDGKEIQPKDGSVSVRLNAGSVGGEEQEAVHVTSGGGVQVIGGASSGSASFSVSHFSIYGIIGGEYGDDVEKKARYTYVFKVNGQEVDRQVVINGEQVTAPADPKVSEGKFKGWMIEGESTPLSFPYTVTIPDDEDEDREFVVNASIAETFTATFWKNEGKTEILETKEGAKDEDITTSDVTWRFADGTAIIGWTLNGQPVTSFKITENVELLPIVSGQVCEVSFETGEGSPIPTVFVEKGKSVAKPADPTRSGYRFKGWFTDSACTTAYNFTAQVNADLRLYAKWEGENTTYKVVYWQENANDDSYTIKEVENKTGKAGETATYDQKSTADGREYQGFTLNAAKSNEVVIVKGDGTTIKNVYYDRKKYPFILYKTDISGYFSQNYKSTQIAKKDFKYQQDTSAWYYQITSQYPGRVWYTTERGDVAFSAPPPMQPAGGGSLRNFTGLSAYGRTTDGTSYVLYLDNGNPTKEIRQPSQQGRVGWHFTDEDHIIIPGWTFAREGKTGYETYNGKKNTYVGRLYYTRNNYKLSFDPQDGTQTITVNNVPFEAALAGRVPSSPKVGDKKTFNGIEKTFVGWFDNEACLGAPVNFSTMKMPALSNNGDTLMFYGKWMNETYTVSFDLDGGQYDGAGAIEAQEVESGNQATAPDASKMTKTDPVFGTMTFGGWQDNSGKRFSFDTRITSNVDLKAIWNTDKTQLLTVQYDTNGGKGSFSDGNKYQDGAHAIIKGQPVAEDGKYFVGWKVGNSDVILASGSFQVKLEDADANKVVKLTAQYAAKPSYPTTVIYNANGGKFGDDSITIEDTDAVVNGNYTVKGYKPTREGHTFKGWALTTNALAAVYTAGQKVASGKDGNVLYAVYELNKTSVDVVINGNIDDTKTYNGTEQEVTGFTYKAYKSGTTTEISNAATVSLADGKTAKATGTAAGEYKMNLPADYKGYFNITLNDSYSLGKVTVNDGKLTIGRASATVKADDKSKPFGAADPELTATVTGTFGKDILKYELKRDEGESVDSYNIKAIGDKVQSNYNVTYLDGTFTIYKAGTLNLSAEDYKGVYDGKEHYGIVKATPSEGTMLTYSTNGGETWTAEAPSRTDVGTTEVTVKATNPSYSNEPIATYTLTITPKGATVTTGSASKEYDSTPLTNDEATITGLVGDEIATVIATGSQTNVGSSKNTYEIIWGTTNKNNYTVTENLGTLEVTKNNSEITLTAGSSNKEYDGTPLTNNEVTAAGLPEGFTVEATMTDDSTITNAGVQPNKIASYRILKTTVVTNLRKAVPADPNDVTENFGNIKLAEGTLEVKQIKATVTITGHREITPYTGSEQAVEGYDVVIDDPRYAETDYTFTGNAVVKGTKPGVYPMGLSEEQFVNNNENFDVKFIVEDGELKITGTVLDDEEEPKKNNKSKVLDESDAPDRDDSQVKGDSETKRSNGNGTKTGDGFLPTLYMILMLIAMAVTSGVIIRRKLMSR